MMVLDVSESTLCRAIPRAPFLIIWTWCDISQRTFLQAITWSMPMCDVLQATSVSGSPNTNAYPFPRFNAFLSDPPIPCLPARGESNVRLAHHAPSLPRPHPPHRVATMRNVVARIPPPPVHRAHRLATRGRHTTWNASVEIRTRCDASPNRERCGTPSSSTTSSNAERARHSSP